MKFFPAAMTRKQKAAFLLTGVAGSLLYVPLKEYSFLGLIIGVISGSVGTHILRDADDAE
jgi:hypothetical protein